MLEGNLKSRYWSGVELTPEDMENIAREEARELGGDVEIDVVKGEGKETYSCGGEGDVFWYGGLNLKTGGA